MENLRTTDKTVLDYLEMAKRIILKSGLYNQNNTNEKEGMFYIPHVIEIAKMIQAQEIADERAEYERA